MAALFFAGCGKKDERESLEISENEIKEEKTVENENNDPIKNENTSSEQDEKVDFDLQKYSLIYTGSGKPAERPEKDGVLYLDVDEMIVYTYNNGTWDPIKTTEDEKIKTQTVTFCYSDTEKETVRVEYGKCIELPTLKEEGKRFLGWYVSDDENKKKYTSFYPVFRDLVFYPEFDVFKYKICYFIGGKLFAERAYFYDEKIEVLTAETDDGIFVWKDVPKRMPAENLIFYAEKEETFLVVFADGRKILKSCRVRAGENAAPPFDTEKEGFDFIGWVGEYENVTNDIVITAEYSKKSFNVAFYDGNNVLKREKVFYGASATAPAPPIKDGFEFSGWSADFSCVKQNLDIYANYGRKEVTEPENEDKYRIINGELYISGENEPERVVLDGVYVEDDLCENILSDEKILSEEIGMENEVKSMHLSDFINNERCIVPVQLLVGGVWKDCSVEVTLNY